MKNTILQFIRRFLGRIVLLLNLGAIVWLGICVAAAYTHPASVRYISIFSLSTPFAILANILFIFAWLILSTRKIRALLSALALVASYKIVATIFAMNYFKENDFSRKPNTVKIMHWNAHGMGLFDEPHSKEQKNKIIDYITSVDADIISLPEFAVRKTEINTTTAQTIMRNNGYKDYRFQADNTLGKNIFLGTAIFSRYKIYNFKAHKLSDYIYMLQNDVVLPGADTIRMFSVHLATFGLSDNDKDYIEEVAANGEKADLLLSRSYLWKFNYAFLRRAREAKVARDIIDASPYPVVISGDLNDLPGSYTYTSMSKGLKDAFLQRGSGLGRTYSRLSPTLRIDYIFYDPSVLRCIGYKSPYTPLSDHNPVIANFEIKPKA